MSLQINEENESNMLKVCCESAVVICIISMNIVIIVSVIGFIYAAIIFVTVPVVVLGYDYILYLWEDLHEIHEEILIAFYLVGVLLTLIMLLATLKKNNYWKR